MGLSVWTGLGFTDVVDPSYLKARVEAMTAGRGADVLYEYTGVAALLQPSAELVRRGDTLALLGFPLDTSTVSYGDWQVRGLTVIGSLAYNHDDFVATIQLIAEKRIDVAPLHTVQHTTARNHDERLRKGLRSEPSTDSDHPKPPLGRRLQ